MEVKMYSYAGKCQKCGKIEIGYELDRQQYERLVRFAHIADFGNMPPLVVDGDTIIDTAFEECLDCHNASMAQES